MNGGKITASSTAKESVFSLERVEIKSSDTFVNFSALINANHTYKHQIGLKFFDEHDNIIKEVHDRLDISVLPVFVSYIPKGAKYFRPYIRLNFKEIVEISHVAILVL